MAIFGQVKLTNKGRDLQVKAQTGVALNFSRMAIGDGQLDGSSISELNALKNEKLSMEITKLKVLMQGQAIVGAVLSNQDISTGFHFREIGVFAIDPDAGEILYCYANAGATADYIPAGGDTDIIEKTIDIITLVGNASNITAEINQSLVFETPEGAQEKADAAKAAANTYTDQALASHSANYVKHPGVGTTTNSGNAYAVSLDPAPAAYTNGMGVVITVNADSTAAATLNVNGLGVRSIKKANGNAVINLKKDGVYTLRYNSVTEAFILQGEGGAGNAQPGEVLSGKTFSNDTGDQTGTMPNRGTVTITPTESDQILSAGYYSGGTVKAAQLKHSFEAHLARILPSGLTANTFRRFLKGEGYWYASANMAILADVNGTILKTVTFTAYTSAVLLAVSESYMFWQSSDRYTVYQSDKNGTLIKTFITSATAWYIELWINEKAGRVYLETDAAAAEAHTAKALDLNGTLIFSTTANNDSVTFKFLTKTGIVFERGTQTLLLKNDGTGEAVLEANLINAILKDFAFEL